MKTFLNPFKFALIAIALMVSTASFSYAENPPDEGMWLPLLLERLNYVDMQKMGLHLTADELYNINHNSLKDAIVGLSNGGGGGRTGIRPGAAFHQPSLRLRSGAGTQLDRTRLPDRRLLGKIVRRRAVEREHVRLFPPADRKCNRFHHSPAARFPERV